MILKAKRSLITLAILLALLVLPVVTSVGPFVNTVAAGECAGTICPE